jgi:hypothetical protein
MTKLEIRKNVLSRCEKFCLLETLLKHLSLSFLGFNGKIFSISDGITKFQNVHILFFCHFKIFHDRRNGFRPCFSVRSLVISAPGPSLALGENRNVLTDHL